MQKQNPHLSALCSLRTADILLRWVRGYTKGYNYPFFGAYLTVVTGLNQNPDDGDTWMLSVYDTYTYQIIGHVVLTYDRASDCILHQGTAVTCGHYVTEDDPKIISKYFNIYFFGECVAVNGYELLGTTPENFEIWTFTPVRFKPQIETLSLAEAIRPTLQQSQGESTTVSLIVKDDLNCGRALKGVDVAFENFFVQGSGGHANITQEAPITGYYTALQGSGGIVPATEQRSVTFENPNPVNSPSGTALYSRTQN